MRHNARQSDNNYLLTLVHPHELTVHEWVLSLKLFCWVKMYRDLWTLVKCSYKQ